jgi:C1A family cysteine protease
MGVNKFSDLTDFEIKQMNGLKIDNNTENRTEIFSEENLADSIDWRSKGAVTPVKDQGQCGSCWAFSTTGSMEGAHFVASGNLLSLSESNLVDCSWLNHGCNGGLMNLAFMYAESHPLESEADYPYTPSTGVLACKYNKSKGQVQVKTYKDVTRSSASQLKAALNVAPVSVGIQADQPVFHHYTGGIITSSSCGTSIDHGVLAVGYGTDQSGQEYYIVKNSWGSDWGEQGFVRIGVEEGSGICGIQLQASQPTTN